MVTDPGHDFWRRPRLWHQPSPGKAYQSSTRVQVMSAPGSSDSYYSYYSDQMLAKTYAQTLTTRPILDGVEDRLGIRVFSSQIKVKTVSETQLIDISVEYSDPQLAANIANTLVEVFAEKNNELQASRFLESGREFAGSNCPGGHPNPVLAGPVQRRLQRRE